MAAAWKIRVVLLGDAGTGKSMLMQRCTRGGIADPVYPTIGIDYSSVDLAVDGVDFKIQMWDTGGQERFRSLVAGYYRGAAAILLCVAADSMRTRTSWSC
jgi:small GTP-binding protein